MQNPIPNTLHHFLPANWPDKLRSASLKFRAIKLDQNFYQFLQEDGIFIHPTYLRKGNTNVVDDKDLHLFKQFPDIAQKISEAIEEFDGAVFVKLNWKCPMDCKSWLSNMKSEHIEDVV